MSSDSDRNNGANTVRDTRGRFSRGNKGRPKGSRHKATRAVEALLEGEAETLTKRAVELALAGDTTALRLCLERLLPPRKETPLGVALPALCGVSDVPVFLSALIEAVSTGVIMPSEAEKLTRLVDTFNKASELIELDARLRTLEANGTRSI